MDKRLLNKLAFSQAEQQASKQETLNLGRQSAAWADDRHSLSGLLHLRDAKQKNAPFWLADVAPRASSIHSLRQKNRYFELEIEKKSLDSLEGQVLMGYTSSQHYINSTILH